MNEMFEFFSHQRKKGKYWGKRNQKKETITRRKYQGDLTHGEKLVPKTIARCLKRSGGRGGSCSSSIHPRHPRAASGVALFLERLHAHCEIEKLDDFLLGKTRLYQPRHQAALCTHTTKKQLVIV